MALGGHCPGRLSLRGVGSSTKVPQACPPSKGEPWGPCWGTTATCDAGNPMSLVQVPAGPLPMQTPANMLGQQPKPPKYLGPCTHLGNPDGGPGLARFSPGCCNPLQGEPAPHGMVGSEVVTRSYHCANWTSGSTRPARQVRALGGSSGRTSLPHLPLTHPVAIMTNQPWW